MSVEMIDLQCQSSELTSELLNQARKNPQGESRKKLKTILHQAKNEIQAAQNILFRQEQPLRRRKDG